MSIYGQIILCIVLVIVVVWVSGYRPLSVRTMATTYTKDKDEFKKRLVITVLLAIGIYFIFHV
jgi:ABC-type uncharacterized transport system permease subunit